MRVGDAPAPGGYRSTTIAGDDPSALAAAIDRLQSAAVGHASRAVVLASADDPAFAMPAAGWAAKTGNPLLFVHRSTIPGPTFAALQAHRRPRIYLLAPPSVVGARVESALRGIGTVTRISAPDPVRSAIAFARLRDGLDGWGVDDPGHGLVFANAQPHARRGRRGAAVGERHLRPAAADRGGGHAAAAGRPVTCSTSSRATRAIRPAASTIARWLIGDESAISLPVQSRIDSLLEIAPIQTDTTAPR